MKMTLTILGFLAALPAGMALADDDCFVPMADWQPRSAVAQLAADNGWTVRRIKIDDGCYEIDGRDAEGRRIEVTVHPATLAVIEVEYDDGDDGDDENRRSRQGHDDDQDKEDVCDEDHDCRGSVPNPAPAGTIAPPQNGLFGNGAPPQVKVN